MDPITMASSTIVTVAQGVGTALTDNLSAILPVLLPVAVALAVVFGALHWLLGSSHRK